MSRRENDVAILECLVVQRCGNNTARRRWLSGVSQSGEQWVSLVRIRSSWVTGGRPNEKGLHFSVRSRATDWREGHGSQELCAVDRPAWHKCSFLLRHVRTFIGLFNAPEPPHGRGKRPRRADPCKNSELQCVELEVAPAGNTGVTRREEQMDQLVRAQLRRHHNARLHLTRQEEPSLATQLDG